MDYLPFGEQIAGGSGSSHKFTGKERDSESGLDNFEARYFSSSLGRFGSPDPLMNSGRPDDPQSWNRYTYTGNNPLNFTDPTGLYTWSAGLGGNAADGDGGWPTFPAVILIFPHAKMIPLRFIKQEVT